MIPITELPETGGLIWKERPHLFYDVRQVLVVGSPYINRPSVCLCLSRLQCVHAAHEPWRMAIGHSKQ